MARITIFKLHLPQKCYDKTTHKLHFTSFVSFPHSLLFGSQSYPLILDIQSLLAFFEELRFTWIDNSYYKTDFLKKIFFKKLPFGGGPRKGNNFVRCTRWKIAGIVRDMPVERWEKKEKKKTTSPMQIPRGLWTRIVRELGIVSSGRSIEENVKKKRARLFPSRLVYVCSLAIPPRRRPRNIFRKTF